MKYHLNKKGSVLFYLIVTMTVLTALGTGLFYMTTTSAFSGLGVTAHNKARYLAEAGMRYALTNLRTLQNTTAEYKLNNAAADKFILDISEIGGEKNLKSTGIANPGTPFQASHKIELLNILPAQYQPLTSAPFSFTGTGSGGITSLTTLTGTSGVGKSGATGVYVDTGAQKIDLGMGITQTYGCAWYQGWANSNGSDCVAGRCNFNKGIRAYFDFQYNTDWQADGFTFALISAHNNGTEEAPQYINNVTDCGGGNFGEYMGYAGPGTTGNGLQPPKIAVEFDPHVAGTSDVCNITTNVAQGSSRRDSLFTSPQKHASFTYWGTNDIICTGLSNTYDDNRHGNGDANNPKNPENGDTNLDGTKPYIIQDYNIFGTDTTVPAVGKRLSFRLEIDRIDDTISADYRNYKLRAWLKAYAVYQDSNGVTLDDTSKKFNQNNDFPPDFQQTITLTQDWHDKFDRMLFGWTQGTGGLTQTIAIRNFKIDFKSKNDF
ncbi:MAG: pilus assembly PilX N-terminal domain-containing protein [Proteobacteria bacterium]|nr:pilus assembly PilX N-terminal domain-containing protein [Pseudomonadota bacterium]